jgi:hypothetical protein
MLKHPGGRIGRRFFAFVTPGGTDANGLRQLQGAVIEKGE